MICTANTKDTKGNTQKCIRKIGHGGLHCYVLENRYVVEFSNLQAWFPHYKLESVQDLPE